jgi:hypothetical protein
LVCNFRNKKRLILWAMSNKLVSITRSMWIV